MPAGEIPFEQIDDFHPDRLYARLDLFQGLRQARANPPARQRRSPRPPAGQAGRARCRRPPPRRRRARRADPQHRRAAHRQGHLGADQAVSGGGGCRDRGADAHAAARPGVPVARSGLARRALVDLEPGARREPAAAPVRRDARRAARRHRRGAGPDRADGPLSSVGRPLARRAGCPGLVGARRAVPLRPLGHETSGCSPRLA